VASPVILYQLWLFIAPGLYRHERRWVWPFVILSVVFFVGGGYFGYAVGFPMVAKFLVATGEDFMPVLKIDDYLDITSKLLLGMGLVFETPILIFFLARMGVVTERWLLAKFRYAVLIIFIIAALITPTPDIPTQCAFALPMCALYLLGVGMAWVFKKRDPKDAAKTET
jgi:sec-independent protein translocase protein TatC